MSKLTLFDSAVQPACEYCKHGSFSRDHKRILCVNAGVIPSYSSCKKFAYAPLKRIPKRARPLPTFDRSDFEL